MLLRSGSVKLSSCKGIKLWIQQGQSITIQCNAHLIILFEILTQNPTLERAAIASVCKQKKNSKGWWVSLDVFLIYFTEALVFMSMIIILICDRHFGAFYSSPSFCSSPFLCTVSSSVIDILEKRLGNLGPLELCPSFFEVCEIFSQLGFLLPLPSEACIACCLFPKTLNLSHQTQRFTSSCLKLLTCSIFAFSCFYFHFWISVLPESNQQLRNPDFYERDSDFYETS